jgi:hypothetical protein
MLVHAVCEAKRNPQRNWTIAKPKEPALSVDEGELLESTMLSYVIFPCLPRIQATLWLN